MKYKLGRKIAAVVRPDWFFKPFYYWGTSVSGLVLLTMFLSDTMLRTRKTLPRKNVKLEEGEHEGFLSRVDENTAERALRPVPGVRAFG